MDINEIGTKIKYARDLRNVTLDDVANKIGVAKSTIQRYENGHIVTPKIPVLQSISNALNINPAWLVGKSDEMEISSQVKKGVVINVLGRVAAGVPIEAIEDIIDTEEITEEMAKSGEFFGLQIHGDSMAPKMEEKDVVIVRKQEDAESGSIVIAIINGDDATCKRLMKYEHGISLTSFNSKYEPMYFSNQEILEKPVKVIGKVVELRCKFD